MSSGRHGETVFGTRSNISLLRPGKLIYIIFWGYNMQPYSYHFPTRIFPGLNAITHRLILLGVSALFFTGPVFANLVINEIMQNPSAVSDDSGEWFEIFNPDGAAVDIDGWTMKDDGSNSHVINNGGPLMVPAGGYLVLGNNSNTGTNGGVTVAYQYPSNFFMSNSADELVLEDLSATEIDRVNWDGGPNFPDPTGASMSLLDPALDNNVGSNWCTSTTPFGAGDLGTPGAANNCNVVDEIPTVTTTTPANGGTGVAVSANIEITFSEDVTTTDPWFTITCTSSGSLTASVTGGPQSFSLDPSSDFALSESCDVVIIASQVADQDGNADNMASDYSFSFDTNPVLAGDLVINEVDYDQSGTDFGEFIEIKNRGDVAVDLNGWIVEIVNGRNGGASVATTINLPDVSLAAGDYFVICGEALNVFPCDLDVSPDSNLIQNGAPDAVGLRSGDTLVDAVSYEGDSGAPYTEGSGEGLADFSSVDFSGISRFPDGVDTNMNNVDFSPRCVTPGAANSAETGNCVDPAPPILRINEIDYDQPGADSAEFIEIINAGRAAADLSGFELVLINGSGGGAAVYDTIALPSVELGAGDYFVVCDSSANVANCDLEGFSSVQNGGPDAVALVSGIVLIDTVSYEGDTAAPYTEGSGSGLADSGAGDQDNRGISRFPDGQDTNQNNVDLVNACITPGIANTSLTEACSGTGPVMEIFEIQGNGFTSPVAGQGIATLDNVVTAVGPEGFFIQTPVERDDNDIDTSNGIYVYTGSAPGVSVGDGVNVAGSVIEFREFTEFSAGSLVTVVSGGNPLPAAIVFDSNVPSPDPMAPSCAIEFECYEGMLVEITNGTVTGPNQRFSSDIIAEVYITAASDRTYREPGIEFPGIPGLPEWDGNPEVFELDPDKLGLGNDPIPAGSHFDAAGVLASEFFGYELWPTSLSVVPAVIPQAVRDRGVAEMTVGALNLFRLYDDIDDPAIPRIDPDTGIEYGDPTNDTVIETDEYMRRLTKFSGYIRTVLMSPDILAVSEVESLKVLQDLADQISADDATVNYTPYLENGNDIGGINVGFLVLDTVEMDAVTQLGRWEILQVPGYDDSLLNDRPPLLFEGRQVANGSDFPIAVISIHSRSLGGIDGNEADRVQAKRLAQAQFVAQQAQDLQTANPDINLVIAGDFNAFEFTDSYVDVTGQMKGEVVPADNVLSGPDLVEPNLLDQVLMIDAGERYSFIFRGNAQTLDHALTSTGLDELVRDFQIGRGNADAAVDLINDDSTVLRSSDHDGLVLFLAKDSDGDGVTDDADYCPGTVIPEAAPTDELRTNNFALVDDDRLFDTKDANGVGPEASFDIFDTAGCSCEQIVVEQGLGKGHLKFGCSVGEMEEWVEWVNLP